MTAELALPKKVRGFVRVVASRHWKSVPPSGVSFFEHKLTVIDFFNEVSKELQARQGQRLLGMYADGISIVAGREAFFLIESLPQFKAKVHILGLSKMGWIFNAPVAEDAYLPPSYYQLQIGVEAIAGHLYGNAL